MEIENIDYVVCPICKQKVKRIVSSGHLRKHKMTIKDFKEQFPNQVLSCANYNKKLSTSQLGKIVTQKTRKKISKRNKGKKAWNKGLTKETDERVKRYGENTSKTRKLLLRSGKLIHNSLGQKRSLVARKNISDAHIGQISTKKNKTFEELYGKERAKIIKNKIAKKARIQRAREIKRDHNRPSPGYNIKACKWFKSFDAKNNTEGRYAVYGGGEYCIKELGYWLDYINFDIKLIIEWDEPHHYDNKDNLEEKDIKRQKEIQKIFPGFFFKRIKEDSLNEETTRYME